MNAPKNPPVQIDPVQIASDRRFNETPNDEISLSEVLDFMVRIVDFMIRKRSLILSVTIIFTLLAAGYALSITPMYKATIGFLMPKEITSPKNTTKFENIVKETRISLYQKFLMKIQSYNFQREVFENGNFLEKFVDNPNGSVKSDAVVLEINKSITLTGVPAKNTELFNKLVFLEMEGSKPEAMAEFLNALVKTGIKTIDDDLSNAIDQRLETIAIRLSQEKEELEKEIAQMTKDLALARSMNIEESNFKNVQPLHKAPRWYLYGAQILEVELKALKSKAKNSDSIKTANLDMEIKTWESFKTLKSLDVVDIEQPSMPPTQPIQNKKPLIILAGLIVGLLFGSILAYFQHARRNLNARRSLVSEINNKKKSFVFEHSSQTAS